MKPQKAVKTETLRIAAGTAVLCAVMLLVYLLLGQLRWQVSGLRCIQWMLGGAKLLFNGSYSAKSSRGYCKSKKFDAVFLQLAYAGQCAGDDCGLYGSRI